MPVKWVFNPPACPWWGGFYERLVGIIKSLKVAEVAIGDPEELSTVITVVENIVSDGPTSYVRCHDDKRLICRWAVSGMKKQSMRQMKVEKS